MRRTQLPLNACLAAALIFLHTSGKALRVLPSARLSSRRCPSGGGRHRSSAPSFLLSSLCARQELPARLLSPAHGNNTDRGKTACGPRLWGEKKEFRSKLSKPVSCGGNDDKSGFNGAVVRLLTAQVSNAALLATKLRVSGTSRRQLSECVFPAKLATGRGREKKVWRHRV